MTQGPKRNLILAIILIALLLSPVSILIIDNFSRDSNDPKEKVVNRRTEMDDFPEPGIWDFETSSGIPIRDPYLEEPSPPIKSQDGMVEQYNGYNPLYRKVEPELLVQMKQEDSIKVLVVSSDIQDVLDILGRDQKTGQKKSKARLDTAVFEIESYLIPKIASLDSTISLQIYRLREPPIYPADLEDGSEPSMWNAVKYHAADTAWDLGYNGSGVKVAVIDTGVDFGHPDLNGTQARDENPSSPYYGWPLAFDSRSMQSYLTSGGQGFTGSGGENNWFSDTSIIDTDGAGNGTLDSSGYNVTGILSQSGNYRLGKHPDTRLRVIYGNYVDVLVVDENQSGVYDTVYVNLDNDLNFTDEKPCRKWDEVSNHDLGNDSIPDRSGGLVYFIADGINPVPYSDVIAAENGYALPIPYNGSLVAFMINDPTEGGGDHGTKCASAVAGQGVIASGRVKGTAPRAEIISIGNFYQGGNELDAYYFAVEGYDGIPGTGDEAQIVSCSFGDSEVIDGGWDFTSRFVDNLTTNYAPNVTFAIASGNGGYGYGTVASPGSSMGVVTVGAALNKRVTEVVYWSNRGPNSVGQLDPDVVSVGVSAFGDQALNLKNNGNTAYRSWSGTSLATPVAAGIIALIYDAYYQSQGEYPSSQLSREILMSTADNLNYDPLVQGAGFCNATRAVSVASATSGLLLSPPFWTAGDYRGIDYDSFAHILHPGESDDITFSVSNAHQNETAEVNISDYLLTMSESYRLAIESNKSLLDGSNNRPDFLIPLFDSANNISHIPNDTALLKVSAAMPYLEFDKDLNYNQENRFTLTVYNWRDSNGNGSYWNDTNGDGVSQSNEIEWGEISGGVLSTSSITATTQEARVHDPLTRMDDGIIIGIFHLPGGAAPNFTHIYLQSLCYNRTDWSWLSTNTTNLSLSAATTGTFEAEITVPQSTPIGLYEGMIAVNDSRNETAIPVIVNVASNSSEFTFGGNTLSTDLYANDQVFGAFRWGWRYEGGDWRFFFTDIPDSLTVEPGSMLVADVSWDNYPTDIDVFILGGVSDTFSDEMPGRYGPYTMQVNGRSADTYLWAGKFKFNTTTNGPREIISAELSPGLNEIILHNVLYSGEWYTQNLTVELGTVNVTPYPWDVGFIDDVADLGGTQQFSLLSSFNLSGIDARAYGVYPPMEYTNQLVYQNDPSDKTTSNWSREFDVSGAQYIKINISSQISMDIDLFLLRDSNTNGVPNWGSEQVASSTSPDEEEEIYLSLPADGKYWVFVHGWNIPSSPSEFDCYIEVVYGDDLNVTGVPNGTVTAGWEEYINATYNLPPIAGEQRGVLVINLDNMSSTITVPFLAELESERPLIFGLQPGNGTWTNSSTPLIEAQLFDSGSGINTSRVFIFLDGVNNTDNATITTNSVSFIPNSTISEGNHTVFVTAVDMFGNLNSTSWRFFVDTVSPVAQAGDNISVFEDETAWFNGSGSSDDKELYNLTWDFGDGGFGFGPLPSHAYTQEGIYTVTLTVRDVANNSAIDNMTVFVTNVEPTADAGLNPVVFEGEFVYLDAGDSWDTPSDLPTLLYTWNIEGGTQLFGLNVSHVFPDDGTYNVTLVVEDDDGAVDNDTLVVTVKNVAPTAFAGGPYFGDEGDILLFNGSAWDPGSDTFTFEWDFTQYNGINYSDAAGPDPVWTWSDDFSGTIYLRVTDDDGGEGFASAQVTIGNIPPTADAGGPYLGYEGISIMFLGSVLDPGADTITYRWDLDDDGAFDDGFNQTPIWKWYDDGVHNISLKVFDGDSGVSTDTTTVTIDNVAPIADPGGPYSQKEGSRVILSGSASDSGDDTFTFYWDLDNDGQYDDATGFDTSWTWYDDGVYSVSLRVVDDDSGVGTETTTVAIENVAPTANAGGSYTGDEGLAIAFYADQTDPGTDDTFTYLWDFGDGETSSLKEPVHAYDDDGMYTVTLWVFDDDGGEGEDTTLAIVDNIAPVLIGPEGLVTTNEDEQFILQIRAEDVEGDGILFWDDTDLFDINPISGTIQFTPENDDVGTYEVGVTASDGDGGLTTIIIQIQVVNVNDPPTLGYMGPQTVLEDSEYNLRITAEDPDSEDWLVFSDDTELFDIDSNPGLVSFTPTNDQVGVYNITFTATDPQGASDTLVVMFTVENTNDAPVIDDIPQMKTKVGRSFNYTVRVTDIDDTDFTFSDDSPFFEIDSKTGDISFIPKDNDAGFYNFEITVRDQSGAEDTEILTLEIEGSSDPDYNVWIALFLIFFLILAVVLFIMFFIFSKKDDEKEEGEEIMNPHEDGTDEKLTDSDPEEVVSQDIPYPPPPPHEDGQSDLETVLYPPPPPPEMEKDKF